MIAGRPVNDGRDEELDQIDVDVIDRDYLLAQAGLSAAVLDQDGGALLVLQIRTPSAPSVSDGWISFSVDLVGPAEPRLDQATYRLRFDDGREDWLFLVPVAADATTTTYESAFTQEHP